MKKKNIKKRVEDIYSAISKLQDELSNIRKECSHDNYRIGSYSWRIGSHDLARICNICDENIGSPSYEEKNSYLENGINIFKNKDSKK